MAYLNDYTGLTVLLVLLLLLVLSWQLFVSLLIWRTDDYQPRQRLWQLALVWLLPVFGALACQLFLRTQRTPAPRQENRFVPQEENVEPRFGDIEP